MDFGINDHKTLSTGASFQHRQDKSWQPMSSAPRDGTVVEVMCTYGVAPSYSLAKWTTEFTTTQLDGERVKRTWKEPEWVNLRSGGGWIYESSMKWRPYTGEVDNYIDPTGGAQNSPAYWRGAVAQKYGLPLNYFEKQVAKNTNAKPSFWRWLFWLD